MPIHFANEDEITSWNKLILKNPDGGNILQGLEFAQQKESDGWIPRFIIANNLAISVLEKPIYGLGKLWYIPKGPGVASTRELDTLLPELTDFAKKQNVFMIKIEPELIKRDETLADLLKLGLVKSRPIQPNFSTVLVDISPPLEEILKKLNQKGRHALNRAQRDGVIIKRVESSDKNCELMYKLLGDTAAGSFRIRSYSYYKAFWQRYAKSHTGQMFFAYVDSQVVAAAYAAILGTKSTYKDGASVRERTVYGASHLLQWHVIEWAKEKGSLIHDLCGAPPSEEINNPKHPHYGIGRFKTSFNKEVTDYIGTYDLAVKPRAYKIWAVLGERIAFRVVRLFNLGSLY